MNILNILKKLQILVHFTSFFLQAARAQLAPTGVLRAGINLSNFLLVSGKDEQVKSIELEKSTLFLQDEHVGVSPGVAEALAKALSVPLKLVAFPGPGHVIRLSLDSSF